MAAGLLDIVIDQGATFALSVQWTDNDGNGINLTGYEARAQIRSAFADAGGDVLVDIPYVPLLLPVSTGVGIQTPASGEMLIQIRAEDTQDLPAGSWVWDMEVESSAGEVTRLLMGSALVRPEVTRSG